MRHGDRDQRAQRVGTACVMFVCLWATGKTDQRRAEVGR